MIRFYGLGSRDDRAASRRKEREERDNMVRDFIRYTTEIIYDYWQNKSTSIICMFYKMFKKSTALMVYALY